ncbi:hypothetical protein ACIF6L_34820 [Kitasatospora sp. NPDC086009]|uniref:hypothetical protein n=1 Tax=unclassified Kitasatospora TaxID=2633591 RepID=UPI0037CB0BE5
MTTITTTVLPGDTITYHGSLAAYHDLTFTAFPCTCEFPECEDDGPRWELRDRDDDLALRHVRPTSFTFAALGEKHQLIKEQRLAEATARIAVLDNPCEECRAAPRTFCAPHCLIGQHFGYVHP